MTLQRFVQNSFFLNHSKAVEGFVQTLLLTPRTPFGPPKGAVVICERKEDILAVRAQVAQGLAPAGGAIGGVTVYTLDTLARNICSLLALGEGPLHTPFQKPFVDVVTQEKLVEMLLVQSHYTGTDRAPLAKQILALCDAPLPPDVHLWQLVAEASQAPGAKATTTALPSWGLKALLGSYQKAKALFSHYCRFQTLVEALGEGGPFDPLGPHQREGRGLAFPTPLLNSPVLWVEAPQYTDPRWPPHVDPFCPGNFPHWAVVQFREALARAHTSHATALWWQQGFHIEALPERPQEPPLVVRVAQSPASFFQTVDQHLDQGHLCLWADLSPTAMPWMRPDAQGAYPLDPRAIQEFVGAASGGRFNPAPPLEPVPGEGAPDPLPPGHQAQGDIQNHLIGQWDLCQQLHGYLEPALEPLNAIDRAYGWQPLNRRRLFERWCSGQSLILGSGYGHLTHLPMALSLIACPQDPPQVWALGPAHAPTPPSLMVRLLNGVFHSLRRQGVPLAPLAAEITYRGFWTSLPQAGFLLSESNQLEAFPRYMQTHRAVVDLVGPRPRPLPLSLPMGGWMLPQWAQHTQWRQKRGSLVVTVTELEAYILCPQRFLLEKVCGANAPNAPVSLGPGARELGTRAHRMAEVFLADLKACHTLWPPQLLDLLPPNLQCAAQALSTAPLALCPQGAPWAQCLQNELLKGVEGLGLETLVGALAQRVCGLIFDRASEPNIGQLHADLERETLKRVFLRLLLEEARKLAQDPLGGGFLLGAEVPVELAFGPVLISGRIDRIEGLPSGHHHIVDYKTSTIPKDTKELALWPQGKLGSHQHLSLQTGLYTLAWALGGNTVGQTSLMRLRSLNTDRGALLTHCFDPPLDAARARTLLPHFLPYVEALHQGDFAAKPFSPAVCNTCPMAHQCPQGA